MKWYLAGGVCSTSGRSSPDSKCDLQEATCVPRLLGEWMTSLTYSRKGSFWPLISFFFFNFEIIVYRYEIKRSEAERSQVAVPTDSHTLWNRVTYQNWDIDVDTVRIWNVIIATRRGPPVLLHSHTCFPPFLDSPLHPYSRLICPPPLNCQTVFQNDFSVSFNHQLNANGPAPPPVSRAASGALTVE